MEFKLRYTIIYRLWVIISGGVGILFVPIWFDPIYQGFFYTFNSLIAAQLLFELGLGFVITQFSAHEMAHVNSPDCNQEGKIEAIDRLAQIYRFSGSWFLIAAIGYVLLVGIAGIYFFSSQGGLPFVSWGWPWILLIIFSGFNLRLSPYLAFLEGAGRIGEVARLRLFQSVIGHSLMWGLLFIGAKLWALMFIPFLGAVCTAFWLGQQELICEARSRLLAGVPHSINWRRDVLPLQWRIALSWASGYLLFQAITPIAFARLGPVSAGQVGLALAIFNGVQSVGMSWMYTQTPKFAEFVVLNKRESMNGLFRSALLRSATVVGAGVASILVGQVLLEAWGISIAQRLPSFVPMFCLGVACLANTFIFSMALYMRSHKEEPMLVSSVVGGVLTLVGVFIGTGYGTLGMTAAYSGLTLFIGLPWAWILFRQYYARGVNV